MAANPFIGTYDDQMRHRRQMTQWVVYVVGQAIMIAFAVGALGGFLYGIDSSDNRDALWLAVASAGPLVAGFWLTRVKAP